MDNNRRLWTASEDAILYEMVSDGVRFKLIGDKLNRTKNACIGRMHRLAEKTEAARAQPITTPTSYPSHFQSAP